MGTFEFYFIWMKYHKLSSYFYHVHIIYMCNGV